MGRGDRRTRKGKTFSGSYGNKRPHSVAKYVGPKSPTVAAVKPAAAVKAKAAKAKA